MAKSFFQLEQNLRLILNNSEELTLQSSKINEKVEKYIQHTLRMVLQKHDREDLLDMLYTITKELVINGVKANQKRIFFEDQGLDINVDADYEKGITLFKQEFSSTMNEDYGRKARERNIYVKIFLTFNEDGMSVEVENNTPVAEIEERRLREKIKKSMGYNDIAEFYMDNMDNTEGAGLGIALIIILLKGQNIDPNLFRIVTLAEKTVARVEIPFTENYVSKREAHH